MAVSSSDYVYVTPIIKHANYGTKPLQKYQTIYTYGNNRESFNEKVDAGQILVPVGFTSTGNKYHLPYKTEEVVKQYLGVAYARVFHGKIIFLNEAMTLLFSRTNSNIYKNIFPEVVNDMEYINDMIDNTPTTVQDVMQEHHGFDVYDVVYLDDNGKYQKALAEDSAKAIAVGMVTKVSSHNVFTLMTTGRFPYDNMDHDDTSILYLSDKNPGKLVHYTEITNTVYVPVAVYTDNSIIINIQQGSIGDKMVPYAVEELEFELYSEAELNDVVNQIVSGVK